MFAPRAFLFAATLSSALGQVSGNHYEALKDALGLSDSQVSQLQHRIVATERIAESQAHRHRESLGSFGDGISGDYSGANRCPAVARRALCYYPVRVYASRLDLSDTQAGQLEQR